MPLHIHVSCSSQELVRQLVQALMDARLGLGSRHTGIPPRIPVICPSTQFSDFLQTCIASLSGVTMGFEFPSAGKFSPENKSGGTRRSEFSKAVDFWSPDKLRWHLLPLVSQAALHLGHEAGDLISPRDRFAIASLLANQLVRYGRLRPRWPILWRQGLSSMPDKTQALADEAWQRELWQALLAIEGAPRHPAEFNTLQELADAPLLSAPIFYVGSGLMDPLLVENMAAYSEAGLDIQLHLLLPTSNYLGDKQRRKSSAGADEGHPLLQSMGQQAIGVFNLMERLTDSYQEWPSMEDEEESLVHSVSLLGCLQADIRADRKPGSHSIHVLDTDESLRMHCCHSPRRELEVLRDELWRAFHSIPGLKPEEVLVALVDYDTYSPLVEGVLKTGEGGLPVRLSSIPARQANAVAVALLALLKLTQGRRSASEIIELLNLGALRQHLGLQEDPSAMESLANFIRDSGFTHGMDESDREIQDLCGTWRSALDRQLAGVWIGPEPLICDAKGHFVSAMAPQLHGDEAIRLHFTAWLCKLAAHLSEWRSPCPAKVWGERLEQAIVELLTSDKLSGDVEASKRLLDELKEAPGDTELDSGAMLDWLQPKLENATSLRTTHTGEILFGRPEQVQGIPCRVLAILGLQDGAFPRASRLPAWDLIRHNPERWDADLRTRDRQWFLEALLAPTERLILSAANRSLRSAHDGPLSSCVEEVLGIAALSLGKATSDEATRNRLVIKHRIHPFAPEYFQGDGKLPRSYDRGAAMIARRINTNAPTAPRPFYSPAGDTVARRQEARRTIPLQTLIQFWSAPEKAWLKALQIITKEEEPDDASLDDAPLNLGKLQEYQLRSVSLEDSLSMTPKPDEALRVALADERKLPPGALSQLEWERKRREVRQLATTLKEKLSSASPVPIQLEPVEGVQVTGKLSLLKDENGNAQLLLYRPANYKSAYRHRLAAFISAVSASLAYPDAPPSTTLHGLDCPEGIKLPPLPRETAAIVMASLIQGFIEGQERPLCFAPETSMALAKTLRKAPQEGEAALEEARTDWEKEAYGDTPGGEGTSEAAQLAWRDQDPFSDKFQQDWLRWGKEIAVPLTAWIESK